MHLQSAIENLHKRSSDIEHYYNLIGKIQTTDISADEDFQREFNFFYKIRRDADWRKAFYDLFEELKTKNDVTFEYILRELFNKTGNVEASFSSKMLVSINPDMPIWDSLVLKQLGISPAYGSKEKKLAKAIEKYKEIVAWYSKLHLRDTWDEYVSAFDQAFPEYISISSIKKIDFLLCASGMDSISDASITDISVSQTVIKGLQIDLSPLNNVLKKYSFNTEVSSSLGQNINAYLKSILPVINLQQNINELLKPHMEMIQRLSSSIAALLSNIEIPESLIKNLGNINYLRLLREIKWPLFLEDDDSLRTQLENLCEHYTKDYPLDDIAELVCNYYDSSRLDDFFDTWSQITDDKNLLEMLRQALDSHKQGNYFASTSLLMCEVNGIISSTYFYAKDAGIAISDTDVAAICNNYNIDLSAHKKQLKRNHKSEKHELLQLITLPESGILYWDAVSSYLWNITLTSDDNYKELGAHNPLRNKICHGIQQDYGTKEISLKSILVIDLLLHLLYEVKWIASNRDEN